VQYHHNGKCGVDGPLEISGEPFGVFPVCWLTCFFFAAEKLMKLKFASVQGSLLWLHLIFIV